MKCVLCKTGETAAGNTIVTLTRGNTIVIIKDKEGLILVVM